MPKVFLITQKFPDARGAMGFALAEDGEGLLAIHEHNSLWLRAALLGTAARAVYNDKYPEGYDIVDYIEATDAELDADPLFMEAYAINRREDSDGSQTGEDGEAAG